MAQEQIKYNSAKFAFFYLLSLVALVFMAISVGIIIFQIINKQIPDILQDYANSFSNGALQFAISAIIVSTPIYYVTSWRIYKNIREGHLPNEAGVRRWLSYFILFVSAMVVIGWLIATINSYFNGDLTTKFILKTLTVLLIAAIIFTFYLYDIKRDNVIGKKDKVIDMYFYGSLILVLASFVFSLFTVDSPQNVREQKLDQSIVNDFYYIDSHINDFYQRNERLPQNLVELKNEAAPLTDDFLNNPVTHQNYEYSVISEDTYQLCTDFLTNNTEQDTSQAYYYGDREWIHNAGYDCIEKTVLGLTATSKERL